MTNKLTIVLTLMIALAAPDLLIADDPMTPPVRPPAPSIGIRQMFVDGGLIGAVIIVLSLVMVTLIFEQLMTVRRDTLMPRGLEEDIQKLIAQGQTKLAEERCIKSASFLGLVLAAGLKEIELGYSAVEKAMEDSAAQQAARLWRKIEYLSIIGTVAPMLGLLGTVWGVIFAFMEFEQKVNPQINELAPGIYKALVTTLFGLIVAIPAIAAFGIFRNRIDDLVAQTTLTAENVFGDFRRTQALNRRDERRSSHHLETSVPSAAPAIRRETRG